MRPIYPISQENMAVVEFCMARGPRLVKAYQR